MEAFSDGVFAIAITLLILEIAVPAGSEEDLWGALGDLWPSYLAYLVSFATVGAVWIAHTVITEYLDHADSVLLRLNLLLLVLISFLPFPTKLLRADRMQTSGRSRSDAWAVHSRTDQQRIHGSAGRFGVVGSVLAMRICWIPVVGRGGEA